ncbi:kynurenine-oxoglutarate transaminase [Acrasis kona]|uniref:Kynurenine-oxoglutarate transaminase n=1 Tax=Acrasis kona TaxID=1008807 RepID=A0AAW2Z1T9_9EUKA
MISSQRQAEFLNTFVESIWSEFTPLAIKTNSINLGQGFPDWIPEEFTTKALVEQANTPQNHQYTRARGDLQLVNAISDLYNSNKEIGFQEQLDPLTNILVCNGANDGLYISLCSFINPGDEIICIEPYFDVYPTGIVMAGGVPVFVPLRPPKNPGPNISAQEWTLDESELRATITPKTRGIIINTPHNPTGKIFSKEELEMISHVVVENNMIVFSDEVYEFLVFGDNKHVRIANLPEMWDRTITICSSGKTFSVTGWKIGWLIGCKQVINTVGLYNQYKVFCVSTPLQRSVATCIRQSMDGQYFSMIQNRFKDRYQQLSQLLEEHKLKAVKVDAGYFCLVDVSGVNFPYDQNSDVPRDYQFCRWLPVEVGLAAIPTSAFYSEKNKHLAGNYVRFAFCKKKESLESARQAFQKLSQYIQ